MELLARRLTAAGQSAFSGDLAKNARSGYEPLINYRRFRSDPVGGGRHSGIVQFALGDGSVRNTRKGQGYQYNPPTNDWYQLMYASGWKDGNPFDPAVIGRRPTPDKAA